MAADNSSGKEYTQAPVWVQSSACRSKEVALALYGPKYRVPEQRPAPYYVNDQPES